MSARRRRRSLFDELFGTSIFKDMERMLKESERSLGGSGYSLSVSQVGGKTVVRAKVSKDTDVASFRRELERRYPGAEIIIEGGKPLIQEIKEEPPEESKKSKTRIKIE